MLFFPIVLVVLLAAAMLGTLVRRQFPTLLTEEQTSQFTAVQAAVLALLGLLLGFSFSMGVSRYDTRKNAEISEANAIGAAYARTGSLETNEIDAQRALMRQYTEARLAFYDDGTQWLKVNADAHLASQLAGQMMASAEAHLAPSRDAVSNGYLASLTAVRDAAEIRQAALENRIPAMAWGLLLTVSVAASFLIGLGLPRWHALLLTVLPLVVAASLTLIWDLDNPRSGLIRVRQDSMHRVQAVVLGQGQ